MQDVTLSALFVYPIKSARGIPLDVAAVESRGLQNDRRWMVVDTDGNFLTQREHPRMALINVSFKDEMLVLDGPQMPELVLSQEPPDEERTKVCIFGQWCEALEMGVAAADWLTKFLRAPCRLVTMPEDFRREVDPHYAVTPSDVVRYQDGFPFLIMSNASLADLNTRMKVPLSMDRFRPNIVLTGARAFAEDEWRRVRIGEVWFRVVKPCSRCSITTVDQATGAVGKEPLTTLATFRRQGKSVMFGQNAIAESAAQRGNVLRIGDKVHIDRGDG